MTAAEKKAEETIQKYRQFTVPYEEEYAIQCALKEAEAIISALNNLKEYDVLINQSVTGQVLFLQEVKEILENKL